MPLSNPFWRQFPPPPAAFLRTLAILLFFVFLFSIIGNTVLAAYYGSRRRRKQALFLVALALVELFKTSSSLWMIMVSALYGHWVFGEFGCQYYGFLMSLTSILAIVLLTLIACEKCMAITRPFQARRFRLRHKCYLVVSAIIFSTSISMAPILGWGRYGLDGFQISCCFEFVDRGRNVRSYIIFLFTAAFVIPVSTIAVSYVTILASVKRTDASQAMNDHNANKRQTTENDSTNGVKSQKASVSSLPWNRKISSLSLRALSVAKVVEGTLRRRDTKMDCPHRRRQKELKLAVTLLIAVGAFLLAWTPYASIALIAQFGDVDMINPYLSTICAVLAKSSVILNPIVYTFRDKDLSSFIVQRFREMYGCHDARTTTAKPRASGDATSAL